MRYFMFVLLLGLVSCATTKVEVTVPSSTSYGAETVKAKVENGDGDIQYRVKYKTPSGQEKTSPLMRPSNRDSEGNYLISTSVSLPKMGANQGQLEIYHKGEKIQSKSFSIKRRPPVIYSVVIGISQYKNASYQNKARYAENDARAFRNYMVNHIGVSENRVQLLLNKDASLRNIKQVLGEDMLQNLSKDDMVFIYYAGLGETEVLPNSSKTIKYFTCYDTDPQALFASALPFDEVMDTMLKKILNRCHRLVFLADASFEAVELEQSAYGFAQQRTTTKPFYKRGDGDYGRSQIEQILLKANGRGMAAIMPLGLSYDDPRLQHPGLPKGAGWFTYYLLKGMRGSADQNSNNIVEVQELLAYLFSVVERGKNLPDGLKPLQYLQFNGQMYVGMKK